MCRRREKVVQNGENVNLGTRTAITKADKEPVGAVSAVYNVLKMAAGPVRGSVQSVRKLLKAGTAEKTAAIGRGTRARARGPEICCRLFISSSSASELVDDGKINPFLRDKPQLSSNNFSRDFVFVSDLIPSRPVNFGIGTRAISETPRPYFSGKVTNSSGRYGKPVASSPQGALTAQRSAAVVTGA